MRIGDSELGVDAALGPASQPVTATRQTATTLRYWQSVLVTAVFAFSAAGAVRASQWVELDYNLTLEPRSRNTAFIELFDDKPATEANFLQYVNNTGVTHGSYTGSIMHRLSKDFVIQGGGYWANYLQEPAPLNVSLDPSAVIDLDGNSATSNPTVVGEYNLAPFRSNMTGTLAMALSTGPNSGTSQWFVNLADNTFLDNANSGGPFTVFGRVAGDGMTLFNAFNGLSIANLNPDTNDDGTRDGGPFFNYSSPLDNMGNPTDGTPYLGGTSQDLLVTINQAKQIDYFGANMTIDVGAGLMFYTRDAFIDTGTAFTGTGGLIIANGRRLGIRENYVLDRAITNHGTLAPGLQLGTATVPNYYQYVDGNLEIQLRSTTTDTGYDRLAVTNSAFLAGKLSVSLINDFVPVAGNSFTVVNAGSITGIFTSFDLPQLTAGLVWNINRSSTAYTLSIVAADYNLDGVVDSADYAIWRSNKGMTTGATVAQGDSNGDGAVNDADYLIWRANLGNVRGTTSGVGSGSLGPSGVPEPGAWLLLLLGMVAAMFKRRTRF